MIYLLNNKIKICRKIYKTIKVKYNPRAERKEVLIL